MNLSLKTNLETNRYVYIDDISEEEIKELQKELAEDGYDTRYEDGKLILTNPLFESNNLKDKQKELVEDMTFIEHLEETGKVSVDNLSTDEIKELQEVLDSLNYKTEFKDEHLVFLNAEEKKEYRLNEFKRKLIKSKGGSGGVTYRISIPVDIIRELELAEEEELLMYIENDQIVIEKDDYI